VSADIGEVMSCNSSRCGKLGWLLSFVPAADFRPISGDGGTSDHQFNKHVIHHLFCSTCGIQSFAKGRGPDGSDGDQYALPGRRRSRRPQGKGHRRLQPSESMRFVIAGHSPRRRA
jgi:hypothetical protein